ncbi:MAG: hypothetical protein JXA49_05260 [Actinobacteria bacterium]|nr:hypothetical protein [Actinomycetota bacterium]
MAFQDMPHLPAEYMPRLEKLAEKAKRGELELGSVMGAMMPPMIAHVMPVLMRTGGEQIAEMIPRMMSALPSMLPAVMGKQIFVHIREVGFFIAKIGIRPKLFDFVPSSLEEIKKAGIPGVSIDPGALTGGIARMTAPGSMKVYGINELIEMFSGINISRMMYMMPEMMGLMTKEVFQSMQEPVLEAVDQLLTSNGV